MNKNKWEKQRKKKKGDLSNGRRYLEVISQLGVNVQNI